MIPNVQIRFAMPAWLARAATALVLLTCAGTVLAQGNAIESITANQQGSNVVVNIAMSMCQPVRRSVLRSPTRRASRSTSAPPRTPPARTCRSSNLGDVRSLNVVQAGERTRLVFNLKRALNYATAIDGKSIIVTVEGTGGVARAVNASGLPVAAPVAPAASARPQLRDLDFQRGANGEGPRRGRPAEQPGGRRCAPDRHRRDGRLHRDARLPETLRRRLDVTDFGTPVTRVTTSAAGRQRAHDDRGAGPWEQSRVPERLPAGGRRQADQGRPEPQRLGSRATRRATAAKNSRSISRTSKCAPRCRPIADISGLNIITSDSVARQPDPAPEGRAMGPGAGRDPAGQGPGHAQERQRAVDRAEGRTADQGKARTRAARADRRPRAAALRNLPAQLPEGRIVPHRVRPGPGRRQYWRADDAAATACCPSAAARSSIRAPTSCS